MGATIPRKPNRVDIRMKEREEAEEREKNKPRRPNFVEIAMKKREEREAQEKVKRTKAINLAIKLSLETLAYTLLIIAIYNLIN